ncbi:hypothetical protein, partial [Pseudomonas sp. C2B4]|uniref:hypothetical protein n=1 Tax=Pseudomonas sp. C2B4 TaxID=2735270 RepID=UPI001C49C266
SPTSYQTAPSRVCVAAFYRGSTDCQPQFPAKPLQVQSLSSMAGALIGLKGRPGKALGSIGDNFSIEKINSAVAFPTFDEEHSDYWCYIQVWVRYCLSHRARRHFSL